MKETALGHKLACGPSSALLQFPPLAPGETPKGAWNLSAGESWASHMAGGAGSQAPPLPSMATSHPTPERSQDPPTTPYRDVFSRHGCSPLILPEVPDSGVTFLAPPGWQRPEQGVAAQAGAILAPGAGCSS